MDKITFKVAEKFISINGEGSRAGQLAIFIRLTGCNLRCRYCDTMWANGNDAPHTLMTAKEIHEYISQNHVKNVTLTGGEPLLHDNVDVLIKELCNDTAISLEIETNGSQAIAKYDDIANRPIFTLDYKTPYSLMEDAMLIDNYKHLQSTDCVKFVVADENDLEKSLEIIKAYRLDEKCRVYFSPVFDKIKPVQIVDFVIKHNLNNVNVQLQLHKFIWDPNAKGV